jgi:HAD superfamily hydrolase (TIGR01549 family)
MKENSIILWDFDGVLMQSNEVRDRGFEIVLKSYTDHQVSQLMDFHRKNGGLSRYVKFRYFFEEILKKEITENEILELANSFSIIMKDLLVDSKLLIAETIEFIRKNYTKYKMHIVSGSDGNELRYLCKELGIDHYFLSIHGSPTPKKELIKQLLLDQNYLKKECVMIGDSINDWDAAHENGIDFLAYNNKKLSIKNTIPNFI